MKFTEQLYYKQYQDKCNFLNMCILCRYAQFSQAQSQIMALALEFKAGAGG